MKQILNNEDGLALLMTVFVVSLATILVLDFSGETLRYQRQCRMFQERVQADLMLKSAIGLSQALIEFPKIEGIEEDWLGDLWSVVASESSLPIPGFVGEPKLMIVDESSKINVNAIVGNFTGAPPLGTGGAAAPNISTHWRDALRDLFANHLGFVDEDYPPEEARTLGNKGLNANSQVAAIYDWIDQDQQSLNDPSFEGQGIETQADKRWFFNRPIAGISELALIPGMTLERLARASKFVRSSPSYYSKINVNTAPAEVLSSIGFDSGQVSDILQQRLDKPIDQATLSLLTQVGGNPNLAQITSVQSQEFSTYIKIVMPNVTRWARAIFSVQGPPNNRTALRNYLEVM